MTNVLLACDGCFKGAPAVISFVIIVIALIGTIYMLLASNLGMRQGYLVLMVSLFAWMIIMSAIWLLGAPGTTAGTGPRAREPQWIPFTATSEVAKQDFPDELERYPDGWDAIQEDQDALYPGGIDAKGEIETVRAQLKSALARLAVQNKTAAVKPDDWDFRTGPAPIPEDNEKIKLAENLRFLQAGDNLLFGVTIPETDKHPATTVFAYRDKGVVFLYGLIFLVVSILGFILHLMLLARFERKQDADNARLEPTVA